MKTLLIKPNTKKIQYEAVEHLSAIEMPLWLLLLANCYKNSVILDAEAENLSRRQILSRVTIEHPDRVVILATGSHPSAHIQQKSEADSIAMDIKYSGFTGEVDVYDKLVFNPITVGLPRWELVNTSLYRAHNWHCWGGKKRNNYASVFSSISCPFDCEFCCIKSFYGSQYKTRSVNDLVLDFYTLHMKGVTNFKMMDELFAINEKRIIEIGDKMQDIGSYLNIWAYARIDTVTEKMLKALKQMGVTWLAYGIESGNDDIRRNMNKGDKLTKSRIIDVIKMTKDAGIHTLGNYMFGFWEDTKATMEETLALAKDLNCEYANFYCTVAYPGSKLYEDMKLKNVELPKNVCDYSQMSSTFKPLPTETVSAKDVLQFRDEAFKEYYSDSTYLKSVEKAFGPSVLKEISEMMKVKVLRK
jgi:radical SAM superfamily enzyme YgiQ (UPF0313 family)